MSPKTLTPISLRYSLFKSRSMCFWMRLSVKIIAQFAAAAGGIPASTKNEIQNATLVCSIILGLNKTFCTWKNRTLTRSYFFVHFLKNSFEISEKKWVKPSTSIFKNKLLRIPLQTSHDICLCGGKRPVFQHTKMKLIAIRVLTLSQQISLFNLNSIYSIFTTAIKT